MSPVLDARERLLRELAAELSDRRVLDAMGSVPRPLFVPAELREFAWLNQPLPLDEGQTISQPLVVAHMCELLRLRATDRVLDVGTGSGYHAAVLSRLAGRVYSIERHPSLSLSAGENLRAAGISNVELIVGDGWRGYPAAAPYDAINVAAASAGGVPVELEAQLADGGRLIIPIEGGEGGPGAGGAETGPSAGETEGGPRAGETEGGPGAGEVERGPRAGEVERGPRAGEVERGPRAGETEGGPRAGEVERGSRAGRRGQRLVLVERRGEELRRSVLRPVRFVPLVAE